MTFRAQYLHELDRLGLTESTCPYAGMATGSDAAAAHFLTHLQRLEVGATWRNVFPDMPEHWDLDDPKSWTNPSERLPLGAFDYPNPPRGTAIIVIPDSRQDIAAVTAAVDGVHALGIPVFGAGLVLDRGAPHAYVVLPLGASADTVHRLSEFLREQPGVGNAYPQRYEPGTEPPDDEEEWEDDVV